MCLAPCAVSPWDWGLQTCPLSLSPGCLSVVSVVIFFLSLSYLPSFSPNPCPSPSVGLNKQSLNTPVCVGGVDADGVCGPHGLTVSPALQQDLVPRGCPGAEEEEGTALVATASAHPGAGKWLGVPVLGVLEDKDNCLPPLPPLLQGPVPLMWPNRGDQGEQELGVAGAQLSSPLELGQPSSLHRSPALVGTSWASRGETPGLSPHPSCHEHRPTAASLPGTGLRG